VKQASGRASRRWAKAVEQRTASGIMLPQAARTSRRQQSGDGRREWKNRIVLRQCSS